MTLRSRLLLSVVVLAMVAVGCGRDDKGDARGTDTAEATSTTTCDGTSLQATDIGITADSITIEVMADVGSSLSPGLFHEYIEKDVELRVTVIGDDVFVAEIHSQDREATSVDWRDWDNGGLEIRYSKGALPDEVQDRCVRLVRSYGLNFSTMDIVRTPDGRHVFLENNPNGNFMWIEKLVPELRMTSALAACLARGSNS